MFRFFSLFCCLLFSAIYSYQLIASPWVNTDDRYLKTSISILADAGYLNIPINTYPLMWQPILAELTLVDTTQLNSAELFAFLRLMSALNYSRAEHIENFSLSAASDNLSAAGFGLGYAERAKLSLGTEHKGNNWAFGIQKNLYHDVFASAFARGIDGDVNGAIDYSQSHDWQGSYAAVTLGNWVLSASQQHQWWGPGVVGSNLDTAAPAPQVVRINRLNSAATLHEALKGLGAVSMTLEYGRQPGSVVLRHHQYTAARIGIKPWHKLEFSASVSHHQRLNARLEQSFDVADNVMANNLAAQTITNFDLRYSYSKQGAVYAALSQVASEKGYVIGSEYHFANQQHQFGFNVEYQRLADDYPYWLINANTTKMFAPSQGFLLAMQWYKNDGTAAYVHFKQQRFASSAVIKADNAIQLGFQHALFTGLISMDYQLTRQQTMTDNINFAHAVGLRWQWRW